MSAPAPVPFQCSICGQSLKGMADTQKVKDRGAPPGAVRCFDYAGCMVRAARNRRIEIGAPEVRGDAR